MPAGKMPVGSSFYLFKTGIRPEWEDKANEKSGSDGVWMFMVLSLIGGKFDVMSDVSGGTVAMREREFRISVWVKNKISLSDQYEIGKKLKTVMRIGDGRNFYFRTHEEDKKRGQMNMLTV